MITGYWQHRLRSLITYALLTFAFVGSVTPAAGGNYAVWTLAQAVLTDSWSSQKTDDLSAWKIHNCSTRRT